MKISVVIITRNEEANVARCLRSVAWADEIIVLDSGSTDATAEIARGLGARVEISREWPGFGPQKNRALALATGEWILSLDADEWVTPELHGEIRDIVASQPSHAAFRMPRSSSYCGTRMRHGGWWPDYVTRLFRRGKAHFSDDLVHERLIVVGSTNTLKSPLQHEAFRTLEQVIDKMNSYSSSGAFMRHAAGDRSGLAKAILHGAWTFFRTYVLRAGLLDGRAGFMLAISNAEGAYYRYLKLMLLNEKRGEQ